MKPKKPIIAIDGPVGAGKSTTARAVAERLGFLYVDTGAMYRAATLDVLEHNVDPSDEPGVCRIVRNSAIELVVMSGEQRTLLDGRDISDRIRDRDVTRAVSAVSALGCVRARMTELQRRLGSNGGVVMEGRDIGTVVFPEAECKIYLDASVEVRAGRRHKELTDKGIAVSYEELVEEIRERDRANTMRELAPLRKAEDAILVDTTGMNFDEQVHAIVAIVREKYAEGEK